MDREHIIRIVLEGKDRLSGVLRNATNAVRNDVDKLRRTYVDLGSEQRRMDDVFRRTEASWRSQGNALDGFRNRAERLGQTLRRIRGDLQATSQGQGIRQLHPEARPQAP